MENQTTPRRGRVVNTVLSAAVPVLAMYLLWLAAVAVVLFMGSFRFSGFILPLVVPFAVALFLGVAAFATEIFLVYADDGLVEIPAIRAFLFLWTGAVAFGVYSLTVNWGFKTGFKGQAVAALGTVNLLVFACLCATWMAAALKKPSELVPVCAVVALADLFSVLAGPTRELAKDIAAYYEKGMEGPPPFSDFILIKIPVPGLDAPMPLFGVSDWIILAFLCSAMVRFGLSDSLAGPGISGIKRKKRLALYAPVAVLGLGFAVLAAQVSGMFLPALPIMVGFFLVHSLWANEAVRRLDAREWRLIAGFSVVLLTLLAAGLFMGS